MSGAAAVLAALSFVSGLWALIHFEPPAKPGMDYNIKLDITPVTLGLLLAGIVLVGLYRFLHGQAAKRAA